jgi:hypothetical protein
MKNIVKLFVMFSLCLSFSIIGVSAASTYDVSCTSTTHTYNGVKHYFVVNGEVKTVGNDRVVQNITTQWHSNGQGTYYVTGSTISNYENGNYVKKYSGTSTIRYGSSANATTSTKKLNASLNY